MDCSTVVKNNVCVEAKVTVTPDVEVGDIESCCVGKPKIEACPCKDCEYMVSQLLCVKFPLRISAKAEAEPEGIVCDCPELYPLPTPPVCKRTQTSCIGKRQHSILPLPFIIAMLCCLRH